MNDFKLMNANTVSFLVITLIKAKNNENEMSIAHNL